MPLTRQRLQGVRTSRYHYTGESRWPCVAPLSRAATPTRRSALLLNSPLVLSRPHRPARGSSPPPPPGGTARATPAPGSPSAPAAPAPDRHTALDTPPASPRCSDALARAPFPLLSNRHGNGRYVFFS